MPVLTLFSMLAYQHNAFLAFSLPLPSHHPFPSFLVVGSHRSLLSPGPHVTINNHVQDLPPSNWDVIKFKYCDDTRPESQRAFSAQGLAEWIVLQQYRDLA